MKHRQTLGAAVLCAALLLAGCAAPGDSGTGLAKGSGGEAAGSTAAHGTEVNGGQGNAASEEAGGKSGGGTSGGAENGGTGGEAAGSTAGGGAEVTIGFSGDPDTWDPCAGFGATGSPLFSTLVKVNGDDQLENDLATDYAMSSDGLTWTFHLREGVVFSNGEALDAEDVAFTFLTAKEKASTVDLTMLEHCTALDGTTVEFRMNKPCVTFLYTIAGMGIVPKDSYTEEFGMEPIGSGPYVLAQWDKGQQFILEANPRYYGEPPAIRRAVFLVQEEDARFVAAKAGEVDIALTSATLAPTQIEGMRVVSVDSVDNRGITLPMLPNEGKTTPEGYPIGNDVTCDPAVRRALCTGIDRRRIIDEALNGFAAPAYSECDGLPWWNPEDVVETDVNAAAKALEDAGWTDADGDGIREKDGLKAEFTLMYFAGDSMRQAVAMSVANQAAENLGISITVEGVSASDTVARMFSEPMIMGWGSDSPMTSYLLFHSSNAGKTDFYNPEFFTSETVDGYLDRAMNSRTMEESLEWWKKAQWDGETGTSMRGEAPWAFYVNMTHLYYVRDGLDIGKQRTHAHGAAWPLVANLSEWTWAD